MAGRLDDPDAPRAVAGRFVLLPRAPSAYLVLCQLVAETRGYAMSHGYEKEHRTYATWIIACTAGAVVLAFIVG